MKRFEIFYHGGEREEQTDPSVGERTISGDTHGDTPAGAPSTSTEGDGVPGIQD
jgi:hypothetical protein